MEFKFEMGEILKDMVTGFEGAVMVRAEYSSDNHPYPILNYYFCHKSISLYTIRVLNDQISIARLL